MATIKDIARMADVSTGTVDRALNNKPGVSPKTRQKILDIAASLNYTTNRLGKGLTIKRQNIRLGFILEPIGNPYFEEMKRGVEKAKTELEEYGIITYIYVMNAYDESEQIRLMENLKNKGISGIALNAINSQKVCEKINELVDSKIKVVTCNTDNNRSRRHCFVGFQNELSGRVGAELLAKFTGEHGHFLLEIGFEYILAHKDRQKGFLDKISESYPEINIADVIESCEDDNIAFEKTLNALNANPAINGIFVAGYGVRGVVNAVKHKNLQQKVKILCYDYTFLTENYVKEGLVDAILCQDPLKHGYTPLKILSELVIDNKEPKHKIYLTNLDIRLKENINAGNQEWEI